METIYETAEDLCDVFDDNLMRSILKQLTKKWVTTGRTPGIKVIVDRNVYAFSAARYNNHVSVINTSGGLYREEIVPFDHCDSIEEIYSALAECEPGDICVAELGCKDIWVNGTRHKN